jgi:hypothetical protein
VLVTVWIKLVISAVTILATTLTALQRLCALHQHRTKRLLLPTGPCIRAGRCVMLLAAV